MPHRAVYKTTNAEYLDDAASDPNELREALERLKETGSLEQVTRELEGREKLPENSAEAFVRFAREQGADTFEQTVRTGFRIAMELAIEKNQPIETFWITTPDTDFELHVTEGRNSVLVFFFVAGNHTRAYGSARAASRSWVIRTGDRDDIHPDATRTPLEYDLLQIQVSGESGAPTQDVA